MLLLRVLFVCIAILVTWLAIGHWLANLLMHPRLQPIRRTPAEYGLAYEDIDFVSQDHLRLYGWWIPAVPTEPATCAPVVIILHPLFGNRHGLVCQQRGLPWRKGVDVDLLQTAQVFHQAGYAVLMFDFRGHGASQSGLCAGGFTEDQDVMGAVDYVFARLQTAGEVEHDGPARPIVGMVGYGLGAAAAIAAIGREKGGADTIRVFNGDSEGGSGFVEIPPLPVKYLRFLVAVEPVSVATVLYAYLGQAPRWLKWMLIRLVDWCGQQRGGFPIGVTSLLKFAGGVNVPLLHVCRATAAPTVLREAKAIYAALPEKKETWRLADMRDQFDIYRHVGEYPAVMLAFAAKQCGLHQDRAEGQS